MLTELQTKRIIRQFKMWLTYLDGNGLVITDQKLINQYFKEHSTAFNVFEKIVKEEK